VLLLDVVLGHGAHPDPAAELAPAIADAIAAAADDLAVVVSLCGTAGDPQGRDRQAAALVEAGASVHLSNAAAPPASRRRPRRRDRRDRPRPTTAVRAGAPADGPRGSSPPASSCSRPPCATRASTVVPVDWRPPVDGHLAGPLAASPPTRAPRGERDRARAHHLAEPHWVGITTARDAVGIERGQFLHAGPPITWERASGPDARRADRRDALRGHGRHPRGGRAIGARASSSSRRATTTPRSVRWRAWSARRCRCS
jgi:hypothetical protein